MEMTRFTFTRQGRGYSIPSREEIYPLTEIAKYLIRQGFVFCRATTGGGISEIYHTGDAPYGVCYRDLERFRTHFVKDFFEEQEKEKETSGGWISSLNYGYVDVYLKRENLRFRAAAESGRVALEWHGYTGRDTATIDAAKEAMERILGVDGPTGCRVLPDPGIPARFWD